MSKPKPRNCAIGRIVRGPDSTDELCRQTIDFVRDQLPAWRDDPARPSEESEPRLNYRLCTFLNSTRIRDGLPMVTFQPECPQTGQAQVDFGAHTTPIHASTRRDTSYDPFLVIEVVHLYRDGQVYEVEFETLDGRTAAIVTLKADQVRPVSEREITHARELAIK